MYARGINDEALDHDLDRYIQVVSCNTHNISVLIKTLAVGTDGVSHLESGRFLCMRRANDISQDSSFIPSPSVGRHDHPRFGTHHARDAYRLFETLGYDLPIFSSSVKLNTQYMHALHFSLQLDREITTAEAIELLAANARVALTHKRSANQIFSFGRDHGYYGRILSQTVVPIDTLAVRNGTELVGFCFTPQDGNALLSSIAATLWHLHGEVGERLEANSEVRVSGGVSRPPSAVEGNGRPFGPPAMVGRLRRPPQRAIPGGASRAGYLTWRLPFRPFGPSRLAAKPPRVEAPPARYEFDHALTRVQAGYCPLPMPIAPPPAPPPNAPSSPCVSGV